MAKFESRRILVIGDLMLDRYIVGSVSRISPEAPVPVVRVTRQEERLGGASNVAYNVVKAILENNAAMVQGHESAKETIAANAARNTFLPFHPGAVKYYNEKGIKLDPATIPK